jgi:guanylate kinase
MERHIKKGRVFVVSGPSGAGKTTLCDMLRKKYPELHYSISTTTRPQRVGEQDGVEYFFTTPEAFKKRIEEDNFVEWACVHGNYYGTGREIVERCLEKKENILLEVDVQGGISVKDKYPEDAVLIFISPPSVEELKKRLFRRQTDTEEVISRRLANALSEMEKIPCYDFNVINDNIEDAFEKLKSVFISENCRVNT